MSNTSIPKQVIVMRKDLNMRKGKMVAQGAHASMKVFLDLMETIKVEESPKNVIIKRLKFFEDDPALFWLGTKFTKIVVSVNSEAELLAIYEQAKDKVLRSLIQDVGATEFHGVATYTCCAIGPDLLELIDPITKHLPLL